MNYSAVVPSKDIKSVKFSVGYLVEHSLFLKEVLIYWNGSHDDFLELEIWSEDIMKSNPAKICLFESLTKGVYQMYNRGVVCSTEDHVLLFNDDMYFPNAWDSLLKNIENPENSVITFDLIESGYVSVNAKNTEVDFGKDIESFDKSRFNLLHESKSPVLKQGSLGWFMPVIFPKELFRLYGGFPIHPEFPHPNDIIFFDKLKLQTEIKFIQLCGSPIYHFQRLSQRPVMDNELKSDRLNLCCGDDYKEGYVNVDNFAKCDIVMDLDSGKIDFPDNTFSEVIFQDAIEHFRLEIGMSLCKEILRILKPGGMCEIRTPEIVTAIHDYLLGYNQYDSCSPVWRLYGRGEREGQVHKYDYTADSHFGDRDNYLPRLILEWGFSRIEYFNPPSQDEFGIRAYKHV